jgi:hypothetical protein
MHLVRFLGRAFPTTLAELLTDLGTKHSPVLAARTLACSTESLLHYHAMQSHGLRRSNCRRRVLRAIV